MTKPRNVRTLTTDDLGKMLKVDLLDTAVRLLEDLHATRTELEDTRTNAALARDEAHTADLSRARAEARTAALEEALAHERARVDALTGTDLVPVDGTPGGVYYAPTTPLSGDELAQALAGVQRLLDATGAKG